MLKKRIQAALLMALLTGCSKAASLEPIPGPASSPGFCDAARPILTGPGTRQVSVSGTLMVLPWEDSLTDQTAKDIEDANCRGVRLCGWPDPARECEVYNYSTVGLQSYP